MHKRFELSFLMQILRSKSLSNQLKEITIKRVQDLTCLDNLFIVPNLGFEHLIQYILRLSLAILEVEFGQPYFGLFIRLGLKLILV